MDRQGDLRSMVSNTSAHGIAGMLESSSDRFRIGGVRGQITKYLNAQFLVPPRDCGSGGTAFVHYVALTSGPWLSNKKLD